MQQHQAEAFKQLLVTVYAFYRVDMSPITLEIWWRAMKPFDLAAVNDAFNRHLVDADSGRFLPKPADVVRMIQGGSADGALQAWTKVDRAVRMVGTYQSVCFDDPAINAVIADMGGWVALGLKQEKDWAFVAKEFETRYRGYRMKGKLETYPRLLVGIAQSHNGKEGYESAPPVLIGDAKQAELVYRGGVDQLALQFTPMKIAGESGVPDRLKKLIKAR